MIKVFTLNVYAFLDLVASLYFMTFYVAMKFDIFPKKLCEPLCFSTPVGESILVVWVYLDCVISINHKDTTTNLFVLDMVDFDDILGMDWIHAGYAPLIAKLKFVGSEFLITQL